MSAVSVDAIPGLDEIREMKIKQASGMTSLSRIPHVDIHENGDVDKRKRSGTKKLSLMKRIFHWKPELEPLTPTSDGLSSPSDRLSFKSDGGSSPGSRGSHGSFFGFSDIAKKSIDRHDLRPLSTGPPSDVISITHSPTSRTSDTDTVLVKPVAVNDVNIHDVATDTTNVQVSSVESPLTNDEDAMTSPLPLSEDNSDNALITTELELLPPITIVPPSVLPPTVNTTAIAADVANKIDICEDHTKSSHMSTVAINIANLSKLSSSPTDISPVAFRKYVNQNKAAKAKSDNIVAVSKDDSSLLIKSKTQLTAICTSRAEESNLTPGALKSGPSPIGGRRGAVVVGVNRNRSPTEKTVIQDECKPPVSPKAVASCQGVSVATVMKKFQPYSSGENASFDEDSEDEGDDSPRETVGEAAEGIALSPEKVQDTEVIGILTRSNAQSDLLSDTSPKLPEISGVSGVLATFQKRLVYWNSVEKLHPPKIPPIVVSPNPPVVSTNPPVLKSLDLIASESAVAIKCDIVESPRIIIDAVDSSDNDFDSVAVEDTVRYEFEVTSSPGDEEEIVEYFENQEAILELEKDTDVECPTLIPQVEEVQPKHEEKEHHESALVLSLPQATLQTSQKANKTSLFAQFFGRKGPICCASAMTSDTCYSTSFSEENGITDDSKVQVTVSSTNATSDDGELENMEV